MPVRFEVTEELLRILEEKGEYAGGIASLIERSALLGIDRLSLRSLDPLAVEIPYRGLARPVLIAKVGAIDATGVFFLRSSEVRTLEKLEEKGRSPGVLVLYGDGASTSLLIETKKVNSTNVPALYRRLALYKSLGKPVKKYPNGKVYAEIPEEYAVAADGVLRDFLEGGD